LREDNYCLIINNLIKDSSSGDIRKSIIPPNEKDYIYINKKSATTKKAK